jgi:hypothetical protein
MTTAHLLRPGVIGAAMLTLAGAAHAGDLAPGRYTLTAVHSGKCVDVAGGGLADGTNIQQFTCNGGSAQRFDVVETSAGVYKLTAVASAKLMDVAGGGLADGTNIQQWSDNGSNAQRFKIALVTGSTTEFTLVNVNSGKCVDVAGGSTADNANVQQWTCNGNAQQRYKFTASYVGAALPTGRYTLKAKHSGKCMDAAGAGTADGTNVQQLACMEAAEEYFDVRRDAAGYFQFANALSGKVLDVFGSSQVPGGNVDLWTNFNADNQRFTLVDVGNGRFRLKAKHSGLCVQVAGKSKLNGANVEQGTCKGGTTGPQQQWLFTKVSSPTAELRQHMLDYFYSISGRYTLVGVENKDEAHPTSDTARVDAIAGRPSSLWGGDFGFGSYALTYRQTMVNEARNQFNKGALPILMYHACAPTRDEYCSWDDIGGAHPADLSDAQFQQLLTPGTALYNTWIGRLDTLAGYFQQLKDANVVVLFRPLHEINQCVFWWACHTGTYSSAALFRLTRDYLVKTKGLDNIIWVWNVQDFTTLNTDVDKYTPGIDYFDIASLDVYNTGYTSNNYNTMLRIAGGKLIAIGENQFVPSQSLLASQPKWLFEMLWPDFIDDPRNHATLPGLYGAGNVLTLDEMGGWR